jgi:hypothetical protein
VKASPEEAAAFWDAVEALVAQRKAMPMEDKINACRTPQEFEALLVSSRHEEKTE